MIGTIIAKRYAKALLETLKEKDVEVIRKDLDSFQNLLHISKEMRKLLLSPVFGLEEKKSVLKVLSEKVGFFKDSLRFFELLIENDRMRYLKEIRNSFETLLYDRKNRVKAHVISFNTFSSTYEEMLKERLRRLTKKEIELDVRTDPSLIGGLIIRIGDVIYDGSIKGQLTNIKEELLGK